MATITWTGAAGDGNYSNPANWSPQQVPTAADTVTISTTAATVINASNGAAEALTTNKYVTLGVGDNSSFTLGSGAAATSFSNGGTFALNGSYYGDNLIIGASKVTLTGGGVVVLSDFSGNRIYGATATDTLNNVNNTIKGAGQLGLGTLTLINGSAGIIDATGGNALVLNTGSVQTANSGLMEATLAGGGGLIINSSVNSGTAGRVSAAGGNVYLQGGTLAGGTLSSTGTSAIVDNGGATLDGSGNAVLNLGLVTVTDQNVMTLLGTLTNQGTLALQSTYYGATLAIGPSTGVAGTVTLGGGGLLSLTDHPNNRIQASQAGAKLVNLNNTISGAGQIGNGTTLNVVNSGTIDANATNALYINTLGSFANNGLLESTDGTYSGLIINSVINSSGGGTISAAGGNVYLQGATLAGGLVTSHAGYAVVDNANATLDGSAQTLTNQGSITVVDNNTLYLRGTITNHGTIALQSTYYGANLVASTATVTLTGSGTVTMTDHPNNRIFGATAGTVLDNINNTITGAGQLGYGTLTLINGVAGVIDASAASNALVLGNGSAAITNSGLIESTGTGGLTILNVTVDDTSGGTLLVRGGNLNLQGATVLGGTLAVAGAGGTFIDNGGATLDGSSKAVTNLGTVTVTDNNVLTLLGTLANDGTLSLQSTYYGANLDVGPSTGATGTVTLTGGGVLNTTDHPNNRIQASQAGDTLVNLNNTIFMAGQLGNGTALNVVNMGTIDATGTNALVINSAGTFANDKLLEATNAAGGLVINTAIDSSGGGTILAAGGNVYLQGGTLTGGTIDSNGGGAVIDNGGGTLNGAAQAVTNSGTIAVIDDNSLYVDGTLINHGTVALESTYYGANLIANTATVTLTGGGTITMTDHPNNRIYGASASDVLDNADNTIEGAGQLGYGQLTLINSGIIEAVGGNALYVNLGSTGTNTASGQMLGEGSGGLVFQNGTYTNQGLIQADSGSSVAFQAGAVLTNDSAAGVLTGGTYGAVSAGGTATATASFTGAAVVTDDAAILLSGVGAAISFGGTAIEASLKTIGRGDSLSVLGGRGYTTKNTLSNNGTLALGGGVFKAGALGEKSTALLTGYGTVSAKLTDAGTIAATDGELDLTGKTNTIAGTITGSGTLGFGGTTTLNTGTVLDVSNIALLNKATLNIAAPVSFSGTFDITGTATLAGVATFTSTGLFEATGKGVSTVTDALASSGTISVAAGDSLAFSGGLANTGLILDSGAFSDRAALTGGSLTLGGTSSSAIIASAAGAGNSTVATLTTAGGALNTSGTTLTVTGDYNNTAAGKGNSYNPFAGVTGTIDGQGTKMTVVGVNGTTVGTVNGTLTIAVQAGHTASFEIENTGAAGSAGLRGALQTAVNGGSITGTALSGSGVTAGNFGPIMAGGASGVFSIHYSGGTLTNEAIHVASDFANVAGLTIDIVAQAGMQAAVDPPVLSAGHPEVAHDVLGWLPGAHQA